LKIAVAKTSGFCFGVKRAVDGAYSALKDGKLYLFGELIHNGDVMRDLIKKGAIVAESIDEVPENSVCVIRAHGEKKEIIEKLRNKNVRILDLTCPYVEKIHRIVEKEADNTDKTVIFGKKDHPEVLGIASFGKNPIVALNISGLEDKIKKSDRVTLVSQTTMEKNAFYEFGEALKEICDNVKIYDTVCLATKKRQEEAFEIAKNVGLMIVIGGKKSSNTKELYLKCKSVCENTVLIENINELFSHFNILESQNMSDKIKSLKNILYTKQKGVGVTAGASTPHSIIEEVITVMTEERISTSEFEKELENYLVSPVHTGKTVTGTVEQLTETEVRINIPGYKGVGIISLDELTDDSSKKPSDIVNVGDEITAKVIKPNDAEGYCLLSKKSVDSLVNVGKIKEAYESGEIVSGKVVSVVRGGLVVSVNSVRVFVPAPLASLRYVQDLTEMVNTEVNLKIVDFDDKRNRAKGSIKAVLEAEQKKLEDEFWANVEVNKTYTGKVKSLTSFGAFVDIGGVDGLIHITELSWARIKHPSEVVKEGETVEVYVKAIDEEKKKISLGYKKDSENPWLLFTSKYGINETVECKIVRIVPFGAFAEIIPGVDGLIHISQIANKHVAKPEDELSVGQVVSAKIIDVDDETKKVSLSIRELLEPEILPEQTAEEVAEEAPVAEETPAEEVAEETAE